MDSKFRQINTFVYLVWRNLDKLRIDSGKRALKDKKCKSNNKSLLRKSINDQNCVNISFINNLE